MHNMWIWPILVAAGQGLTVYGLMFLHRLIQVLAQTMEAHIELLIQHHKD